MQPIRLLSVVEQTAEHLRQGLHQGRWRGNLPGVVQLATECDVAIRSMRAALQQLEAEGVLTGRGLGRSRSIAASGGANASRRRLRVAILRHDPPLADNPQTSVVLLEIMQSLVAAGHDVSLCKKSLLELKHDVRRSISQLAATPADAWVIEAGSRPLLEWCATQPTPCLALYGRSGGLPLARTGPDVVPAYRAATRHLLALGHRRIVLIVRDGGRKPTPGICERTFLEELTARGVLTSSYNLPDWEETPQGFHHLLENLFQLTPPTALIIEETPRLFAAMEFLGRRHIHIPEQVSLVSTDCDAVLGWCLPGIAHMRWDNALIVRRVVRWVGTVRKGKSDRRVINFPAEFDPGGSTGPVPNGR
jgi:DNA-binding LacI/PurR family transcriptional regulator